MASFKFELKGVEEFRGALEIIRAKGPQLMGLIEAAAYDMNDEALKNPTQTRLRLSTERRTRSSTRF